MSLKTRPAGLLFCALCLVLAPISVSATPTSTTLIHAYELNGSFADALGGPAMNPNGGTLGPEGYSFSFDQGPNVSGAIMQGNYSIEMLFRLNETSGYRKLIDFKDRTTDHGLYNLGGNLNFFPITTGSGGVFTPGDLAHVVLTRDDLLGAVIGFVNGTEQFAFTDSGQAAVFSGSDNIIHFLRDEGLQGVPGENPSGYLDFVRIYDGPLSASEIAALYQAVPEPATWLLLAGGCSLLAAARRRQASR
jgi:hypothetical protein